MQVSAARTLREEVEDFLYQEAELLDEWRLDEWAALFTEDARYIVPTTDLPDGDPHTDLDFIDDDIVRLRGWVVRLNSRHAHREYPWSRTRPFVSNVRAKDSGENELTVTANVLVYRFRSGEGAPYVGRCEYKLRRVDGGFKISYRRAVLDLEDLSSHGAVSIIL